MRASFLIRSSSIFAKSRFSLYARKSNSIRSSREKPSNRNRVSLSSYSGMYLCKLSPMCE